MLSYFQFGHKDTPVRSSGPTGQARFTCNNMTGNIDAGFNHHLQGSFNDALGFPVIGILCDRYFIILFGLSYSTQWLLFFLSTFISLQP